MKQHLKKIITFIVRNTALLFLLVFFLLFSCKKESSGSVSTNPYPFKFDFSTIEKFIKESISNSAFPGAVLLIGNKDSILYQKAFGHFTYDKNSPNVSTSTIYDLASLTKVIATTTAIMLLVDRKILSLDDKVSVYIPEFGKNGKEGTTIRNLLKHNSGLPAWKKFYPDKKNKTEILDDICNITPEFKPGSKTQYSDLGFITLGIIIEKISGISLDSFCTKEIFEPLKINNTFFNPDEKNLKTTIAPTEVDNYWRSRLLQGEVHDETASIMNGVSGHAGLFSTAEDLYKLVKVLMNDGQKENTQFISQSTIKDFLKRESNTESRLLGWDAKSKTGSSAGQYFSDSSFGHTGFTGTSIWADPEQNLIVVFLTNRVYPSRENKKIINVRPALHDLIIKTISKNKIN
ncbi:MAG: serine hydrolase [Ignavibacteriales bacterium]|nr:MAG: serine hydrolase [Ignavibacteriales bacterium]